MNADESKLCTTNGEPPAKVRAEQTEAAGQHKGYLILCDAERAKGFVKPYRDSYIHTPCGALTRMSREIAETYARDPTFYGATFCVRCNVHRPLAEFTWEPDGEPMDPTNRGAGAAMETREFDEFVDDLQRNVKVESARCVKGDGCVPMYAAHVFLNGKEFVLSLTPTDLEAPE